MVVLVNRGVRTWALKDGKDKDGKAVKRQLPPGGSIESLDQAEADHLLGYNEIVDAEKAMPQVTDKIAALTATVTDLQETITALKARLEKYEPSEDEDEGAQKGKGKKGK